MTVPPIEFSVIISCYFEEQTIDEFFGRLQRTMEGLGRTFEIILTNDGSTDATIGKLRQIFVKNDCVTIVNDMMRNFGQAAGITAGIAAASGKHFVFIDSDLQLDPEELPALLTEFDRGADVVSGVRTKRRDPLVRRLVSRVANRIMRKASGTILTDFGCTFKVFDGRLIRAFELGPQRVFNPVEIIALARTCREVPVSHHPRRVGESGWTMRKLLDFNMEHVVNLSTRPFQYVGLAALVLAGLFVARVILGLFAPFSILRVASNGLVLNVMVILFLIETSILCMIGEFVFRSFRALQGPPKYVLRETLFKRRDP